MTIRFYLHNKAADNQHPIYIEVRWAKHATPPVGTQPVVRETCAKKYWTKKQRVSTQDEGRVTSTTRIITIDTPNDNAVKWLPYQRGRD
jgi:hypothetical protein